MSVNRRKLQRLVRADHSPELEKRERPGQSEAESPVPGVAEQHRRIEVELTREFEVENGRKPKKRELAKIMAPYGRSSRAELLATNPYSQKVFAGCLARAMQELEAGKKALALTIYHPSGDTAVDIGEDPEPTRLQDLKAAAFREVRRALQEFAFFGMFDLAILRERKRKGAGPGRTPQRFSALPHVHGIVFGERAEIEAALRRRFPDPKKGRAGAKVYKLTKLTEPPVWLGYMAKDPRSRYRLKDKGKKPRMMRERMRGPQQRYLLKLYSETTKPELCVGSGLGLKVVQRAVALAGGSRRPKR